MEIAKRVLEKYGWTEGQGLGKNLGGIKEPVKTKIKLDKAGIGHSISKTFTDNWWEAAFNTAANNITVEATENGVKMKAINSNSSKKLPNQRNCLPKKFSSCGFLKRETLENGTLLKSDIAEEVPVLPTVLSDEQLFQACGGRTAHKAARHGLKLSGKLKRLQDQEQNFLNQTSFKVENNTEHIATKLLKNKEPSQKKQDCLSTILLDEEITLKLQQEKKRRRKVKERNGKECIVGNNGEAAAGRKNLSSKAVNESETERQTKKIKLI